MADKIFKIILLLTLVAGVAFYLGVKNQKIVINLENLNSSSVQIYSQNSFSTESTPWYISRSAAITSYLLMFFVILWGTGMTTGFTYKFVNPVKAWVVHKYLAISLGVTILIHVVSLLFDKSIKFNIGDVLIPFASDFKPIYLIPGIISFYIFTAIILTSLLARIKAPKFWRTTHYLAYPLFIFSFIHGVFIGTDSQTLTMTTVYWVTGVAFTILIFYRFLFFYLNK